MQFKPFELVLLQSKSVEPPAILRKGCGLRVPLAKLHPLAERSRDSFRRIRKILCQCRQNLVVIKTYLFGSDADFASEGIQAVKIGIGEKVTGPKV